MVKFEFVQKLHGWFILTRNIRLSARVRKLLASSADYLRVMARLLHVTSAEINLSETIILVGILVIQFYQFTTLNSFSQDNITNYEIRCLFNSTFQ